MWEAVTEELCSLLNERAHGNKRGTFQSAAGLPYSFGFRSNRLRQMIERIGEGEGRVSLCYHLYAVAFRGAICCYSWTAVRLSWTRSFVSQWVFNKCFCAFNFVTLISCLSILKIMSQLGYWDCMVFKDISRVECTCLLTFDPHMGVAYCVFSHAHLPA